MNTAYEKPHLFILAMLIIVYSFGFLFVFIPYAQAARIHGTIYDLGLSVENDVQLSVDSSPKQHYVSKDGNYEFLLNSGNYTISAWNEYGQSTENIVIGSEGNYVIDIILNPIIEPPPSFETDNFSISSDTLNDSKKINATSTIYYILEAILLGILTYLVVRFVILRKELDKESGKDSTHLNNNIEDEHKNKDIPTSKSVKMDLQILALIKKEERLTQKEIRRSVPLSEAKVSLIITQLEHEGKIKKIRKGRGNILVFVHD